jgi:hypothetical protein
MAIIQNQKPPQAGPRAIGMALRDLRGAKPEIETLGGAEINLSDPLPVYRLGLDDLQSVDSLNKATRVGWRYLVEGAADGSVGYADVKETSGGGSKFTGLAQNRNAARLLEAVHLAQDVAKNLPGEFEARILDVPALYVSSVWLASPKPIFIPYIDPERLAREDGRIQVAPDFLEQLLRSAQITKQHIRQGLSPF